MLQQSKGEEKRQHEQEVVEELIQLYCRRQHKERQKNALGLCKECQDLLAYAHSRVAHCPFMETKTFCSNCKVHCYEPLMRERIRQVMRYAGPRLLFKRPIMVLRHMWLEYKEKRAQVKLESTKSHE